MNLASNLFHIDSGHFRRTLPWDADAALDVRSVAAAGSEAENGDVCRRRVRRDVSGGGVLLLKRRLFSPRVRATTTGADILVLSVLILQCALGLLTIPFSAQHMDGSEMMKLVNWAQSVVTFHGGASAHLDGVAFIFRMHLVLGMTLFLLFPFSRLVHIWSVPVEYLTRRYQIVRARR